ncbi:keratin, type I cytoskeletal 19-like isoform X1 [Alligator mississippiensis]|uniref:keratin, type I cytoskeletal 19-like isoform X1 n=1 Tax=Alligator mississippiensis TaxID=8496 RepID=UPI00090715A5|nr:keratin, type I cytoskeletal 19-like isoform X1 [Alligator mississippiensis]
MASSLSRNLFCSGVPQGPRLNWISAAGLQPGLLSIHGGAGSIGSCLSSASDAFVKSMPGGSYEPGIGSGASGIGLLGMNEKDTMQNLNDRLAAYLERVCSLEEANGQLEQRIQELQVKKALTRHYDPSSCFSTIAELRSQIQDESVRNSQLILQIDNAKLTASDFRMKFEAELATRLGVESDIKGLRKVLDGLTEARASLQVQIESLKEELTYLQQNHGEEVAALQGHLGGSVSVEVDASPGINLVKTLAEIRDRYEDINEKNQREAEAWHKQQCETFTQEVATSSEALQAARTKATELKRIVQSLEIELQMLQSTKEALEGTLAETESHYGVEMAQLQNLVAGKEAELAQLRTDTQHQANEYQHLLDLKTRLEVEIATYQQLLEGQEVRSEAKSPKQEISPEAVSKAPTTRRIKTLIEELVDGEVVSSHIEEVEHPL